MGCLCANNALKCMLDWNEAGNAGSQSEPMNCDFLGIVTEGFTILETVFSKYIFVKICVWSSDLN